MYQTHFNLSRKPFHLGPDINYCYAGNTHARALDYLEHSLKNEGLFVLTGGPGTGKTTLLNKLEETISHQFYVARISVSPKMESQELIKLIISSLGIKNNHLSSNTEMLLEIEAFLLAQAHQKQQVIIFVDDCHHLSSHSLEELVLLTKIHAEGTPLVQCLLTGQSSFRHTINTPEFEQLNQFIATTYHLDSLSGDETREYISHRLITAGHKTGDIFTTKASLIIHEYTSGVPRRINQVCARTLHYATDENETSINERIVFNTIDESFAELKTPPEEAKQYRFGTEEDRPQLQDRRMQCRRLTDRRMPSRKESIAAQHNQYTGEGNIYPQLEEVVFGIAVQRKTDAIIIEGEKAPAGDEKPRLTNLRFPINEFFRRRNRMKNRSQNPYTTAVLLIIIPIVYFMLAPNETTDQNVIANVHALENSIIDRQIVTITQSSTSPSDIPNEATNFVIAPVLDFAASDQLASVDALKTLSPQFAELDALGAIGIRSQEKPALIKAKEVPSKPIAEAKPAPTRENIATPKKEKPVPAKPKVVKPKPVSPKPKAIVKSPPKPKAPPVIVKEPAKLKPDNLHLVINEFTEAYKTGDIKKISSILSEDVKTNDSNDKETLTSQYRKLFSITDDRDLTFSNISWKTETDEAAGSGNFKASILEKGRTTPQVYSGTFTIELKKEEAQIAITDIRYEYE